MLPRYEISGSEIHDNQERGDARLQQWRAHRVLPNKPKEDNRSSDCEDCGSRMVASREFPSDHDPGKTISKSCENAGSMRKPSGFASCAQKISASKSEDSFGHTAENAADARRM